ncbi:MAG: stage II sporulation protein M [Bacteroidota bacterium]
MREPAFLRQNKDKWREYEQTLFEEKTQKKKVNPDHLANLYVQLTDDLAYARTFYPKSKTVKYLNGLAARTHLAIYKNKKEKKNKFFEFWTTDLPLIHWNCRRYMLYAFLVFMTSYIIGLVSTYQDNGFVNLILGDSYVNMTIDNIEKGKPTDVYNSSDSIPMFWAIAINNVRVSFIAFASGIFLSVGTFWLLFTNGVMVGAFLGFFITRNLMWEALPIVFIHGTLELSAIVIAGAAGITLGHSILFPGTFSRVKSIQEAASNGIKIIMGLVPVFIIAALLESFVTRLADMPAPLKFLIIGVSLFYVIWYYFIYPFQVSRRLKLT